MVFVSCSKEHRWHGAGCSIGIGISDGGDDGGGGGVVVGGSVLVVAADWVSISAADCLVSILELLVRRGVTTRTEVGNSGSGIMLKVRFGTRSDL